MTNNMKKLGIDLDNVIADSHDILRTLIRHSTDGRVDLSYLDITDFSFYRCKDRNGNSISEEEWSDVHRTFSEESNILSVKPCSGARFCLEKLSERYEIHIVTTRMPNAWEPTVKWLRNNSIPHHFLHFLGHRKKHESLGGFSFVVEDDYDQAVMFLDAGTPCYLLRHPWNATGKPKRGLYWVQDWNELTRSLDMAGSNCGA